MKRLFIFIATCILAILKYAYIVLFGSVFLFLFPFLGRTFYVMFFYYAFSGVEFFDWASGIINQQQPKPTKYYEL